MTRIRCRADHCVLWQDDYCTSAAIEYDPDQGCLAFEERDEEEEFYVEGEWEGEEEFEEDEDSYDEEEEDEFEDEEDW